MESSQKEDPVEVSNQVKAEAYLDKFEIIQQQLLELEQKIEEIWNQE